MKRRIITINEEKCNGCGLCVNACHEGAIGLVNGKAKLMREDFCDGLGDCLPNCPQNAISFEEREAPAYNEAAVKAHMTKSLEKREAPAYNEAAVKAHMVDSKGCPGMQIQQFDRSKSDKENVDNKQEHIKESKEGKENKEMPSRLRQWPCQIKLMPINAPYYQGADLLIAADCTAYAYASFHEKFIKGKIAMVGCPKLDNIDYSEKISDVLSGNDIKSITLVRMEVPCCGGLFVAAKKALQLSGKDIPMEVVTISTEGNIL